MMWLRWTIFRFLERLGFAGYVAIVAALGIGVVYFFGIHPTKNALQLVLNKNQVQVEQTKNQSPEEELSQFVSQFPRNNVRVKSIQTIIDGATENGLGLDSISYKSTKLQDDLFNHYHVDFNLVGNYEDVRSYLAKIMAEMPYISLDKLLMDRKDI
ncbi:MAG TPA: hypothetical protein VLM20_01930, partial [Methylophilaceae bacterium]|nr:hypothetical protein [Methylophilaceae bacterium]